MTNVKGKIMYFLLNASPPESFDIAASNFAWCISHMMSKVLGHVLGSRSNNVFSFDASPSKPLDVATLTLLVHRSYDVDGT